MSIDLRDRWVIVYLPTGEIIPYPEDKRNKGWFLSKRKAEGFLLNNTAMYVQYPYSTDTTKITPYFPSDSEKSYCSLHHNSSAFKRESVPLYLIEIVELKYDD
jgi:hypothetical protein